jgi:hypothetical protein
MLFLKRSGFLLLMMLMGVGSLIFITDGYPLAWTLRREYWFPLAYLINMIVLIAVVGFVFWFFRRFLFTRGRPWLAWFSITCWILIWLGVSWNQITSRQAIWPGLFLVGSASLSDKVDEVNGLRLSMAVLEQQSANKRETICTKAFLEEEHWLDIVHDGIPISARFEKDIAVKGLSKESDTKNPTEEKKLFESNACSEDLKNKYKKLQKINNEIANIFSVEDYGSELLKQVNSLDSAAAQLTLMAHPDSIVALFNSGKKSKEDPIAEKIAFAEMELRIYSNGQVKDHDWVVMPDQNNKVTKAIYLDPRIWSASSSNKHEDSWYVWRKQDFTDRATELDLLQVNCKKKTLDYLFELKKNDAGHLKLTGISYEPEVAKSGTWGAKWLDFACANKAKQAKLPDESSK